MDIGLQSMLSGRQGVAQHGDDSDKGIRICTVGRNVRQRTDVSCAASYKDQSFNSRKSLSAFGLARSCSCCPCAACVQDILRK